MSMSRTACGPFFGLGEFSNGTGKVCVECSARVLACVNTKNRLGRIDGQHPHWVAPHDVESEELSWRRVRRCLLYMCHQSKSRTLFDHNSNDQLQIVFLFVPVLSGMLQVFDVLIAVFALHFSPGTIHRLQGLG